MYEISYVIDLYFGLMLKDLVFLKETNLN